MNDTWWRDDPEATRQGFGMILHLKDDKWVVHRALLGSPAEEAGVQREDAVHMIGGRILGSNFRATKLNAIIELLDDNLDHDVSFLRGREKVTMTMRPRVLRDLFEIDAERGGKLLGNCYSCPSCYSRTSGVANCPGDCPGYTCTTG